MRWSKLKQTVEAMFADEVRGRVELWTTRYNKAHDRAGRSWITVDGREIVNMSNYLRADGCPVDGRPERFAAGVFAGYDLADAMREFLNPSIDASLTSNNPLILALAVLDRRAGRKRLEALRNTELAPLVNQVLAIRLGQPAQ